MYCSTCSTYSHQEKWSFLLGLSGCVSRSTSGSMRRANSNSRQRKQKRSQQQARQDLRQRSVFCELQGVAALSGGPTSFAQVLVA